ncbi:MraY family glycosyltransferase [Elusimicrobiota bacterium]
MKVELYILTFISAVFLTLLFTPVIASLAIKYKAVDNPSGRKIHRSEIPLWGGVAVFIGIFGSMFIVRSVNPYFRDLISNADLDAVRLFEGILVGSIVITILGMVDDIKGVIPTTKLLGQIIAAMIIMQYGIKIKGFSFPFSGIYIDIPTYLVIGITVIWIIGFINSINLIDGVDGLSSGVMAIATMVFFIITLIQLSFQTEPEVIARLRLASVLSLAVSGSCMAFLKFNFPPAKIFLGDSGSLLLGFLAGVITITGILKTAAAVTLVLPVIIFGFPIMDAFLSFLRRIFRHKSFMEADKDHLHHRLLYRRGWNAKKVDFRIYSITLFLGLLAILITILKV